MLLSITRKEETSAATFNVSFSGNVDLSTDKIWPAPEDPTVEDAIEAMHKSDRDTLSMISSWELDQYLHVEVDGQEVW